MKTLLAVALLAGCAAPQVVTKTATEVEPLFGEWQAAQLAARCAADLPLASDACECMAKWFIGKPMRMDRDEMQAIVDKAWDACVKPSLETEGQVSL